MSPTGPNKFLRGIILKGYKTKVKLVLHYVNTNSYTNTSEYKYPQLDVNNLKDDREKSGKLNCDRRKYVVCNKM